MQLTTISYVNNTFLLRLTILRTNPTYFNIIDTTPQNQSIQHTKDFWDFQTKD